MKKFLIPLMAIATLNGCSSIQIVQPQASISPFREEKVKNYKLGTKSTATVGNPIIKRKNYFTRDITLHDRAIPDRDFEVIGKVPLYSTVNFRGTSQIEIPIIGSATIENKDYKILQIGTTNNGILEGILINEISGAATGEGIWRNGFGNWVTGMGATFQISKPLPLFSFPTRHEVDKSRGFENIELIYTGVNGKSINLLYREFTQEDMARPAFFQNITYDIGKSEVIAFKSFRIKIINATNTELTYEVQADE